MAYPKMNSWSTSEAKNKFASLINSSQNKEQIVLRYGKPVAVVIGYEQYLAKSQNTVSIWDLFRDAEMKRARGSNL